MVSPKNPQKQSDLDFIHHTILENHPGVYNEIDPEFSLNLDREYRKARKDFGTKAKQGFRRTSGADEQKKIINRFVNSFNDGHLSVIWNNTNEPNSKKNNKLTEKTERKGLGENFKQSVAVEKSFFLEFLNDDIAWITLPTFKPNAIQEKEIESLNKELTKLKNIKVIVFDLTGNRGGNSMYGRNIMNIIFGENVAKSKIAFAERLTFIDWRASIANIRHIESLVNDSLKKGAYGYVKYLEKTEWGMLQAIQSSQPCYREYRGRHLNENATNKTIENKLIEEFLVDPKVIIIIGSENASAANIFIDEMKVVCPQTILVGESTHPDTLYTEVRRVPLPSGRGWLILPMKVFSNRVFRKNREGHLPDIEFRGDIEELKKLIVDVSKLT